MSEAAATPAPTPMIPPGSSPATTAPQTVTIALDDYHRYRSVEKDFADFKAAQAKELEAKEKARLDALAESGQHKQALEETRKAYDLKINEANGRYAQLEQAVYQKETRTTLAQALAGRTFNAKSPEHAAKVAAQVLSILEPQFEASRLSDGSIQVRHKATGRPAPDVLKEALDSEEFAHFFVTTNRGGAGTDATRTPGNPERPSGFKAIKDDFFSRQAALGTAGMGLGGFSPRPAGR